MDSMGHESLPADQAAQNLLGDIRALIESARGRVARTVNVGLVMLYWSIGRRIRQDILANRRAKYGKQIFYSLSRKLTLEYGAGFSMRNLFHMVRFAEVFPDQKILHSLSAKLTWTHLRHIIYIEDDLKRDFYAEMCRLENWSVRSLENKIGGMLFERTALSKHVELLELEKSGIRVAEYLTDLPARRLLEDKLHQAIAAARSRLEAGKD